MPETPSASFMNQFNERFAIASARLKISRSLSIPVEKLDRYLVPPEQRYVGSQLTLSYDRKRIILERILFPKDLMASI